MHCTTRLSIVCSFLLALVTGCAAESYQLLPSPDVAESVPTTRSRVVLLRPARTFGRDRAVQVFDGRREVGVLGPGHYLVWDGGAQRRLLRLVVALPSLEGGDAESLVDHEGEAGGIAYYSISIKDTPTEAPFEPGLGEAIAQRISAEEGLELLQQLELAPRR